ncbi:hypothetical protein [Pontibacter amylolyticus]|uniref:Uncharacterized protein n=1 Tax=Pontibacter amylolyticus TaxID=1424080 RepID=A0ABQ1W436_9BACT|nr:hypothetical protein [Pontibacter amylolyticus]GGG12860.1 hypothetical protein GCM10011323_16590 [Pontibacter amylolyticus]
MIKNTPHTFHIPVMGLAFSIDSPMKVAQYGISSVVSLSDDTLIEQMREYYSQVYQEPFTPITPKEEDYRARRITAYLNLADRIVKLQVQALKQEPFDSESRLTKYFLLLPDNAPLKAMYRKMLQTSNPELKRIMQDELRQAVVPGSIDVNIMTKLDKTNYDKDGNPLPSEYSDALAALRGFAKSTVHASVIFSAGMNMRLYSYLEQFPCFFPNKNGHIEKQVVIKVSDYRSAFVQGKILAKKGIWVSEFRIESGLNCGGHAFATDGYLLGPILEEFKQNRQAMQDELYTLFSNNLAAKGLAVPDTAPTMHITVQGGIGTADEHNFLLEHYGMDAAGWGTPFLLVPEATTVDADTMEKLARAKKEDLYLSPISPLGVPFNSLRGTTSEALTLARIEKGKPGSPCEKKHLVSNTEFTKEPICTASRKYQRNKLVELQGMGMPEAEYKAAEAKVLEKECLCEGLANTALLKFGISRKAVASRPVAICPGPNLAYFSNIFKLQEMVDHIYGRVNVLNNTYRPHVFINELSMYVQYWKNKKAELQETMTDKQEKYLQSFWQNLQQGIAYYKELVPTLFKDQLEKRVLMLNELLEAENQLQLANQKI